MADWANIVRALREGGEGALQAGASMATGALAEPLAGLAGLGSLAWDRDPERATAVINALRDRLTYSPEAGSVGARGLENVGRVFAPVAEALEAPAEGTFQATNNPLLAAAVLGTTSAAAEALPGPNPTRGARVRGRGAPDSPPAGGGGVPEVAPRRVEGVVEALVDDDYMELDPLDISEQSIYLATEGPPISSVADARAAVLRHAEIQDDPSAFLRLAESEPYLQDLVDLHRAGGEAGDYTGAAGDVYEAIARNIDAHAERAVAEAAGGTTIEAALRDPTRGRRPATAIEDLGDVAPGTRPARLSPDEEVSRYHEELLRASRNPEAWSPELKAERKALRPEARAALKAGDVLTEEQVLALSPAMRKAYVDRRAAELDPMFAYEDVRAVPRVPQREVPTYDPPRGAPAHMTRLAENQAAYDRVREWAQRGMTDEGLGWYNTQEILDAFTEELGPEVGPERFSRFMDLVAQTSAGAKVPTNISIASYYDVLANRGLPTTRPPKGSGYGHKAQDTHFGAASDYLAGGAGLDYIENPKRSRFAENLKGNYAPSTVDKHNVRAWGIASEDPMFLATRLEDVDVPKKGLVGLSAPEWWDAEKYGAWDNTTFSPRKFAQEHPEVAWESYPPTWFNSSPSKTEYAAFDNLNKRLAADLGVAPAQLQAAVWLGAGDVTGLGSPPKAFARVFDDVVRQRAAERGMEPRAVLSDFLQGRRPLEVAGAAAIPTAAAIAALREDERDELRM